MQVGSLVETIITWENKPDRPQVPIQGNIYTIRDIFSITGGETGIRLEEVINPPRQFKQGFMEVLFRIDRFRELQPPMDISELVEESISLSNKCYA